MSLRAALERAAAKRARAWAAWAEPPEIVEASLPELPACDEVLWAGVGGDPAALAVRLAAWLQGGGAGGAIRRLWLWDRDPGRLLRFCERCSAAAEASEILGAALRAGRLGLIAGAELLGWVRDRAGTGAAEIPAVAAEIQAHRYRRELAWVARGAAGLARRRALLVDGGLLVDELGLALEAAGFAVWTWDLGRAGSAALEGEARLILGEGGGRADGAIFAINHVHGLEEAAARLGAALHVWEIDPALDAVRPPGSRAGSAAAWVHSYRHVQVSSFAAAGWRAGWLPLATDVEKRRPIALTEEERARYAAPVAFVGRSMVLEAQAHRAALGRQIGAARLEGVLAAIRARGAWDLADLRGIDRALVPQIAEIAGAEHRLTAAARLGRALGGGQPGAMPVAVWGDRGWSAIAAHGVSWRGAAGHHIELSKIYSNGGIHFDLPRLYQADIVTLRVFEVLACGGFLIAWDNEDLRRLFTVGEEVLAWRTPEELAALARAWADRPEDRARIGAAGRARVARDHTVRRRLAEMLLRAGGEMGR